MYKIYFKQALEMLKQNKFFSIISILGTALAIMMIMSIIVTNEIKNINVAPEINRSKTLYLKWQSKVDTTQGSSNSGAITYDTVKNYLLTLKKPKVISAVGRMSALANTIGSKEMISTQVKFTDPSYWKILSFSFLEGKPFSQEAFESGIREAVLSESTAQRLFKGEKVIGQTFHINHQPYRVVGVVKNVSSIFSQAFADIWIPYSSSKSFERGYEVMLLTEGAKDIPEIRKEIREVEKRFNANEAPWTLYVRGPETHQVVRMGVYGNSDEELKENVDIQNRKTVFILALILLVPAINLSGLNLSRIKKRTAEIGVRKAFGAKRHIILIQVLWENLITSLIGGIIGLMLSFFVVYELKNWLLKIPEDSIIPLNTIVSLPVFFIVFIICILINLLSAGIPAYKASRMTIIHSLTKNDKES